jgi:hypothetical protein
MQAYHWIELVELYLEQALERSEQVSRRINARIIRIESQLHLRCEKEVRSYVMKSRIDISLTAVTHDRDRFLKKNSWSWPKNFGDVDV